MQIEELKEKKRALEQKLQRAVEEFSTETGLSVESVQYEMVDVTTHRRDFDSVWLVPQFIVKVSL